MNVGLLWLEGPLQSWGVESRFGRRATLPFPTRSGILGLVCCAMGKGGEEKAWLEKMARYKQTIVAYETAACPAPPLLKDFHMVGSGYSHKDPWQTLLIPKKCDGGTPVGGGSRLTWRHYIQDMAFACALELPEEEAGIIAAALENPVWPVFLGRKSCPPSDIIWRGEFTDMEKTLAKAQSIANDKKRRESFRVCDGLTGNNPYMTLNDVPVNFGPFKNYKSRVVSVIETGKPWEFGTQAPESGE